MTIKLRYRMVAMLTIGAMINFIDRVNISVAAPKIMANLGWNEARFGLVFSAFLLGYTIFQFPGGIIADRWNAKKVVALSCLGFSIFTLLTPLGAMSFGLMLALRFAVGMFESASFPAYASINSLWIPRREYGRAQMVMNKERVESFLYNLPQYREALAQYPRQGNGALLEKLDELIARYTA